MKEKDRNNESNKNNQLKIKINELNENKTNQEETVPELRPGQITW